MRQKLLLQDGIDDIEIEIKKRLEKEEELIRKRLADLTRTTNDESDQESENEEKTTVNRKDNVLAPPESMNTSKINHIYEISMLIFCSF